MRHRFLPQSSYNQRIAGSTVASGASSIVGIGIVGSMIVGAVASSTDKDGRLINCYTVRDGVGSDGKPIQYLVNRPGFAAGTTPQAGSIGNAVMIWTGQGSGTKVMSAFGGTDSSIYDGTTRLTTNAGVNTAITGKATGITETQLSNVATLAISSSDNTAWYYQDGGTVTKITDGDFPGNNSKTLAGTFAHLDGFACIMDTTGALWVSDVNSLTSWTATSTVNAATYPDKGIGAVRWRETIMCFGAASIQFAQNQGLSPCPMQFADSMTIRVGAISADAIATIGDSVFWIGTTPEGGLTLYSFDGKVERLSTPVIDHQLQIAGASNISIAAERWHGRSFISIIAGSSTFVYCLEETNWHERTGNALLWHKCAGVASGSSTITYAISKTSTSGKVYVINPSSLVYTDDSAAYSAIAQSTKQDLSVPVLKFWDEMTVVADTATTTANLAVSYSDDDYANFTTVATLDLSQTPRRIRRMGASRERAWKFTMSSSTAYRIRAFDCGDVRLGSV